MDTSTKVDYVKVWFKHADGRLQCHDILVKSRIEGEARVLAFYGDDVIRITGSLECHGYEWLIERSNEKLILMRLENGQF